MAKPSTTSRARVSDAALKRRLERLGLTGKEDEWTDRYLLCEHLVDPLTALPRQRFEAVARFIRDLVAHRWVKTRQARENANPKRIYYLSMEFLIGRTLNNNMMNLAAEPLVQKAMSREGWDFPQLLEEEPDAGLGNGGLGRLAACFIDSLATLQFSAMGYGLRYEYGIFHQAIRDGGMPSVIGLGQQELYRRARCNSAASLGKYDGSMENDGDARETYRYGACIRRLSNRSYKRHLLVMIL